jgi:hypothetical protein
VALLASFTTVNGQIEDKMKEERVVSGKYGPKDISGYRYEDMEFESAKYADMSAVGFNMIPKWMFLRRIINDKVFVVGWGTSTIRTSKNE